MSFATRFCTNLFTNSWRLWTHNGAASLQTTARSFHMMLRPSTSSLATTTSTALSTISTNINVNGLQKLLTPFTSLVTQVAGFKVKGHLKRRCKDCYFVIRDRRHYVICPTHPRHKQMSMKKRDYKTWILTHATQSKVRPY